jgi:hypothetical protein
MSLCGLKRKRTKEEGGGRAKRSFGELGESERRNH